MPVTDHDWAIKGVLTVGFAALAVAVMAADADPATAYELSIYAATPTVFWIGVGVAAGVGLVVGLLPGDLGLSRAVAVVLAGGAGFATVALPVIRGYHYLGAGDSLSHLGWIHELQAGLLSPVDLLYPGVHSIAIAIAAVTGVPVREATLYAVLAFVLAFLLFVPLVVAQLSDRPRATAIGAFAGLLLLPILNIDVYLMAHPTTQAILLVPLVLYLVFRYVTTASDGEGVRSIAPAGPLLALASTAVLLVHPQQAVAVLLVFGTVVGLQFLARRLPGDSPIARHRTMYAQTAFLALLFALWAPRHERVFDTSGALLSNLLTRAPSTSDVAQRSASLTQIGSSVEELFLKLFAANAVFWVLASLVGVAAALAVLRGRDPDRRALATYLAAGAVPVLGLFAVFLAASLSTQYFRFLGFATVLATILGAYALAEGVPPLSRWLGRPSAVTVAVLFLVLAPVAALTFFPSPFIYQGSAHVSEQTYRGYTTAFETAEPDVPFVGIRSGPERYVHAIYGTEWAEREEPVARGGGVNRSAFNEGRLPGFYGTDRYLSVPDSARRVETEVYRGFRYSRDGFRALQTTPGVDRVISTGDYRLYRIHGDEVPAAPPAGT